MKSCLLLCLACTFVLFSCTSDPSGTTRGAGTSTEMLGDLFVDIPVDSDMVALHGTTFVVPKGDKIILAVDTVLGIDIILPTVDNISVEYADMGKQAFTLADETGGVASHVKTAAEITEKMLEILDSRLTDNTDLVFMIDVTGSMGDDIENVKLGATAILEKARMKRNVRVAVATYGDHRDGAAWFNYIPLSTNYAFVKSYILTLSANAGGGDWPESMFDAACLVMDNLDWNEDSQKMILVLGDAPSLVPPQSTNGIDAVIAKSKQHGVNMNYYPIIISPMPIGEPEPKYATDVPLVANIFPSPSTGNITVQLSKEAQYTWQVFNSSGMMIRNEDGFTKSIALDLTDQPNGMYIVKITNEELMQTEDKRVIVTH